MISLRYVKFSGIVYTAWSSLGEEYFTLLTSNTADNIESEMLITDTRGLLWKVDVSGLTFSAGETTNLHRVPLPFMDLRSRFQME